MSWDEGIAFLRKDAVIGPLIKQYGVVTPQDNRSAHRTKNTQYFETLVCSIISQQISGKAADAIIARVRAQFKNITPPLLLAAPVEELRAVGLSLQKASYIHDLALKFTDGTVQVKKLAELPDEEIISELVKVKGIGRWTAEMFLIFSLGRLDVWPIDDYGIRKAVQVQFRKRELPEKKFMIMVGKKWAPYRSVASLYLWKSLNN